MSHRDPSHQPPRKQRRSGSEGGGSRRQDHDEATQRRLEEIDRIQSELDQLQESASHDLLDVEQRYNQLRRPIYNRRTDLISSIPNFWYVSFINHPDLSAIITRKEEDCLHHLIRFEVVENDNIRTGYSLHFHFDVNPYFTNDVLTKTYTMSEEASISESTTINWREGVVFAPTTSSSTVSTSVATSASGSASAPLTTPRGQRRTLDSNRSFFTWFTDNVDADTDDIAEILKEDMWINPMQYYLVPDGEEDNDDDEEDGDPDRDDSDSSDGDEDEDEDDDELRRSAEGAPMSLS